MGFDALGFLALGQIPFVAPSAPSGVLPRGIIQGRRLEEDDLAALLLAWYHLYE